MIVYWNNKPVFLNGQPAGQFTHDVCAAAIPGTTNPAGDVTFTIPNDYLKSTVRTNGKPQYLLAVRGVTLAEKSYIDIKVVVDKGYKLTTLTSGPGTIDVSPVKDVLSADRQDHVEGHRHPVRLFLRQGYRSGHAQTGWVGVPFAIGADQFANPVTFSINQNTTVTAYFSTFPAPQTFTVGNNGDLLSTGATVEGSLRWALEKADKYPGAGSDCIPRRLHRRPDQAG